MEAMQQRRRLGVSSHHFPDAHGVVLALDGHPVHLEPRPPCNVTGRLTMNASKPQPKPGNWIPPLFVSPPPSLVKGKISPDSW